MWRDKLGHIYSSYYIDFRRIFKLIYMSYRYVIIGLLSKILLFKHGTIFYSFSIKKSINELIYIFSVNDLNFYNSSVIIY
jgi:hypothetical protein